jgi:hypothetical protein
MNPVVEALRANPGWSRMPRHWVRVALWCFYYTEDVPSRDDFRRALASQALPTSSRMEAINQRNHSPYG